MLAVILAELIKVVALSVPVVIIFVAIFAALTIPATLNVPSPNTCIVVLLLAAFLNFIPPIPSPRLPSLCGIIYIPSPLCLSILAPPNKLRPALSLET